ncbi:UDP-2,3-diacylglucosamine diphosphatase [Arsukibacterium perlucidum]|uniref:UDP-2,3-diacylglucosamine diphosphatase n=1 Tax=Arsukibacterium perlucidum TaxID=368811 RepID=UPI0003702DB2|nr:UDP-2,3-diacylglucosamine diphosphatase [Arsukibacterium perlucidum]
MFECRAIFISDVHLGCKDCRADYLLSFLQQTQADKIYLLGDIIDLWAMRKQVYWQLNQNQVIKALLDKAEQGCEIIYVPGNHDEALRLYHGKSFGNIKVALRSSHTTLQGKKLLLLHGDEFDKEVSFGPLHNWLGDTLYDFLLFLNRWFNRSRRLFGGQYFSLAAYIKRKVPGAQKAIARYRQAVVNKALKGGYDGVVCGHIHHSEIRLEQGIIYCNDGDWIDNCTALVEQTDGSLALYHWTEQAQRLASLPLQPVASKAKAA